MEENKMENKSPFFSKLKGGLNLVKLVYQERLNSISLDFAQLSYDASKFAGAFKGISVGGVQLTKDIGKGKGFSNWETAMEQGAYEYEKIVFKSLSKFLEKTSQSEKIHRDLDVQIKKILGKTYEENKNKVKTGKVATFFDKIKKEKNENLQAEWKRLKENMEDYLEEKKEGQITEKEKEELVNTIRSDFPKEKIQPVVNEDVVLQVESVATEKDLDVKKDAQVQETRNSYDSQNIKVWAPIDRTSKLEKDTLSKKNSKKNFDWEL